MDYRKASDIESIEVLKARITDLENELSLLRKSAGSPTAITERSDLNLLLETTIRLLETTEKRKVLQHIVEGALKLIGLDTAALYTINNDELNLVTTIPPLPDNYPDEFRKAKLENHYHIKKAVESKLSLQVDDISKDDLSPEERIIIEERNMISLLFVPLVVMNKVTGVMILGTTNRKYNFTDREIAICRTISNIGSLSLENSRLFEQLNANIDELRSTISTKERSEEQLRLLHRAVEHSPVSIVVTDAAGKIQYVNPKFCEVTGYTNVEAIGKNPSILKSGQHSASFYRDLWETILLGRDWLGEMQNRKKNGEIYWESVLISPMTDESGRITHFVGIKEDITEKKAMLGNLIAAKEAAEESSRLKTAFLHNISHEIRTPLNAIVGFSTFLNDPDIPEDRRKTYYDIIVSSNDQLLSIIDGIMRISHLETGQVMLVKSEARVKKIMETLFTQFQLSAAGKKLGFKLNNEGIDEASIIITDEGKLKQILSNLLDNALKFTHEGYIEFGCRKDSDFYEFYVLDTGIGIPQEEHDRIFERFYQVDQSKSNVYTGTGLGLSISAGYASLLGGALTVDSLPSSGSVFKLRIPKNRAAQA